MHRGFHFKAFCYLCPAQSIALVQPAEQWFFKPASWSLPLPVRSFLHSQQYLWNKHVSNSSPSLLQVKAAEGERDAWEGFRASLRLLHPALVLPLPPDLLSVTPDLSSLPPPPPPAVEGDEGMTETETDSPMMWQTVMRWNVVAEM